MTSCSRTKLGRGSSVFTQAGGLGSFILLMSLYSSAYGMLSWSSDDTTYGHPCIYRYIPYMHSEVWKIDDCTTCNCHNGTTTCVILSCEAVFCTDAMKPEGECCYRCPYSAVVKRVDPRIVSAYNITATHSDSYSHDFALHVNVHFQKDTSRIKGENMWRLSAWLTPDGSGTGPRFAYNDQILNDEQSSQQYVRGNRLAPRLLSFSHVIYKAMNSSFPCDDIEYLCVQLREGEDPQMPHSLPFSLTGVMSNDTRMCIPSEICTDDPSTELLPCIDHSDPIRPIFHPHGDVWHMDACRECACKNGTRTCTTENCTTLTCEGAVTLPGDCCPSCPYYVFVREVTPLVGILTYLLSSRDRVVMRVPVSTSENEHSTDVAGSNLWRLSAWMTLPTQPDQKRGFVHQILNEDQRSQTYRRTDSEIDFGQVEYIIPTRSVPCGRPMRICVQFNITTHPRPERNLPIHLAGNAFIGCSNITLPKPWCDADDGSGEEEDVTVSPDDKGTALPLLACTYDGLTLPDGEKWKDDDCTSCSCSNGTTSCLTQWCPPTICSSPVKFKGDCCFTCPHDDESSCLGITVSLGVICGFLVIVLIVLLIFAYLRYQGKISTITFFQMK